jgi:7 transmembrane sweet-taste receptor of 3 GCPR
LNPSIEIIHVTVVDIIRTFFIIFSLNFIVLITWQSVSPLKWNRVDREATDVFDRPVDSYGICSSDGALPFGIVTIVMNILVLMFSNWWAYKSRNIETEYNENRYIGISMASMLQAWCMGIPILIVVWDNPQAKFFVETGIIFVTASAVLLLIFIPKILAIRTDRIKAAEENKRLAYTSFTSRVRKKDEMEDDEKVGPLDESLAKEPLASLESNDEIHPVWSTISETGERVSSVDMLEKDEVTSGGQVNSISVNVDDLKTQSISPPITRGGLRNSHIIESITKTIRFSVLSSFNSGESSAPFESLEGLRVTHNPRVSILLNVEFLQNVSCLTNNLWQAPQNLKMSGGLECSRAQLENLEQASPDLEEDK